MNSVRCIYKVRVSEAGNHKDLKLIIFLSFTIHDLTQHIYWTSQIKLPAYKENFYNYVGV